jgi:hypothetical protein
MPYAYTGTPTGNYLAGPATVSTALAVTYAAGECAVFVAGIQSALQDATMSDGTANVYTRLGTVRDAGGYVLCLFACYPTVTGAQNAVATWGTSGTDLTLSRVAVYTGTVSVQAGTLAETFAAAVGTDVYASSAFTPAAQPAAFIGIQGNAYNDVVTAGTTGGAWNDRGEFTVGSGYRYLVEDKRITALSNVNTYFSDASATGVRNVFTLALTEQSTAAASVNIVAIL